MIAKLAVLQKQNCGQSQAKWSQVESSQADGFEVGAAWPNNYFSMTFELRGSTRSGNYLVTFELRVSTRSANHFSDIQTSRFNSFG